MPTKYDEQGKRVRKRYVRKGFVDVRVRRRKGPRCELCGRKHYPAQGCWTGPQSRKRDLKALKARAKAEADAAAIRATVPDPAGQVVFRGKRPASEGRQAPLERPDVGGIGRVRRYR